MTAEAIAAFRRDARWIEETERRTAERAERDPELRALQIAPETIAELRRDARTSIEMLAIACRAYAARPCLGMRDRELVVVDGKRTVSHRDTFSTITYGELWRRVERLATGLHASGIAPSRNGGRPPALVGLLGYGSTDWAVADFACLYLASVSVPLATNLPSDELETIIRDAELGCIFCSADQLARLGEVLPRCESVRTVVIIDADPADDTMRARVAAELASARAILPAGRPLASTTLDELIAAGEREPPAPMAIPGEHGIPADALVILLYTSGSTGAPKGAMYTDPMYAAIWQSSIDGHHPLFPTVTFSYLPLGHGSGRVVVVYTLLKGGTVYFTHRSDMSTWFADAERVRPTSLHLVPRVAEMIHQYYQNELIRETARTPTSAAERSAIEERIISSLRGTMLGGRLTRVTTGTAPTSAEVSTFIERCLGLPVTDYYGATENGGEVSISGLLSPRIVDWKLVAVPELGYSPADRPRPRGELCIRSKTLVSGYYRNAVATAELFDEAGYMRTGDIVEQTGPQSIAWIDRKHSVIKLAQGEFVNPARLEGIFASSPFIGQIYVHGDSRRSYVLAVIVPERAATHARLGTGDESATRTLLEEDIQRIATEAGLRGFEVPRAFVISHEPFGRGNGLLTDAGKPARANLRKRFGEALDELYARIEERRRAALDALAADPEASVRDRVVASIEALLGVSVIDDGQAFVPLGGDSLGAVRLSNMLERGLGVHIPVGRILDVRTSVGGIVADVRRRLQERDSTISFAAVHGRPPTSVDADDIRLDAFLGAVEEPRRAGPGRSETTERPWLLLTGANGFLGRHLALELLALAHVTDGRVTCVIRAANDEAAFERLRASYGPGAAMDRFDDLRRNGRLEVLAGDVSQARLGLEPARYDERAAQLTGIVHNAALVNHALSYAHLFEPNVVGTAEVLRLTLHRRIKPLTFVSTAGLAAGRGSPEILQESARARAIWPKRPIAGGYASGYVTSKWAGELLVDELHDRYGIPTRIFRCGMVLAHPEFLGQINPGDYFTRLLVSLVHTRVAPASFYASGRAPNFQGVPVDLVARTIARVAAQARCSREVYHVVGGAPGGDDPSGVRGASLDEVVHWIRSAGYPVSTIADHGSWFRAFSAGLEGLPPRERSSSLAPIAEAWARPFDDTSDVRVAASSFHSALREHGGTDAVPLLSEAFIHRCLEHAAHLGLIPRPGA